MSITKEDVSAAIEYRPETGEFFRKVSAGNKRAGAVAGHYEAQGYRVIAIRRRYYKAHRLAHLLMTGRWPDGYIDHINGDRRDNRWENLRVVDRTTNMQNQRVAHVKNKSTGLLGVYITGRKFIARITVNKKLISIGTFACALDAYEAYVEAKRRLHAGCTL